MASNGNHERSPNIALLIDADQGGQKYLDAVLTVLAELGTVNIRRAYGNWSKPELGTWEPVFHAYAIMPMQQFDIAKRKNATTWRWRSTRWTCSIRAASTASA